MATLYGEMPPLKAQPSLPKHRIWGLPQFFQKKNYETAYFSGAPAALCDARTFFEQHGFSQNFNMEEIQPLTKSKTNSPLGLYDHDTLTFYLSWLINAEQNNLKTFSTVFTITNHIPFQMPYIPVPEKLTHDQIRDRFKQTMNYTDECVFQFISTLKKNGLDKKCLIVILADHGYHIAERNNSVTTSISMKNQWQFHC